MTPISTIRPGLLVSLKTAIRGNISYNTEDIEADHLTESGARRASWNTTRVIEDPKEHEEAVKCRSLIRTCITRVCAASGFGLLCRESDEPQLLDAIAEARQRARNFNQTATLSHISVNVMIGRVAADSVEAIRGINDEVRALLSDMEAGFRNLDATAIRDAANRARESFWYGENSILSREAETTMQVAIDQARLAARRIVKAGEIGAAEVENTTLRRLREARTVFLDFDDNNGSEITKPTFAGRALDLDAAADITPVAASARNISDEIKQAQMDKNLAALI